MGNWQLRPHHTQVEFSAKRLTHPVALQVGEYGSSTTP
jgi:hypothetical protein